MKQQTAVEWLLKQLLANGDIRWRGTSIFDLSDQAKAMEKEQIKDAHLVGLITSMEMEATKQAEEYYQENYGK